MQVLFLLSYRVTIEIAGFEPTHQGVKVLCLTTWLYLINLTQTSWWPGLCPARIVFLCHVVSPYGWYTKGSWREGESNHRHTGLQPAALPTELSRLKWYPQHFWYLMLENLTTNKFLNIRRVQSDGYCSWFLLPRNCTSKAKGFIMRRVRMTQMVLQGPFGWLAKAVCIWFAFHRYSRWVPRGTHLLPQSHPQPDYIICLSPTNWDRLVDDARCLYERSFLGFCLFEFEGRKTHSMQNLRLGSPTALVHLCGIWPPEFYDIIGLLVVLFNFNTSILVAGFAPASLPFFEANVHSFLYGVWRAWQLTRF